MKYVIVLVALVAVCSGASITGDVESTVLRDSRKNDGVSGYDFAYETSNGIARQESGVLKPAGGETDVIVVNGEASWTAPDGTPVVLKFSADENGYHPLN